MIETNFFIYLKLFFFFYVLNNIKFLIFHFNSVYYFHKKDLN